MNRTKKFAATVGLGLALTLSCAAPALADDCDGHGPAQQEEQYAPDFAGGGTTCVNTGGASASAIVVGSPGVLSGNNIQIPISIPINICGNSVG